MCTQCTGFTLHYLLLFGKQTATRWTTGVDFKVASSETMPFRQKVTCRSTQVLRPHISNRARFPTHMRGGYETLARFSSAVEQQLLDHTGVIQRASGNQTKTTVGLSGQTGWMHRLAASCTMAKWMPSLLASLGSSKATKKHNL